MGHHSLFSRLKRARLVRVLAVYLAASWGLLQVVEVPGDWDLDLSGVITSLFRGRIPHPNWARAIPGGIVVFSLLFGIAGARARRAWPT